MRILLATATALAPLLVAGGAHAQVVITTTRTTPVVTSNPDGNGPNIVRIAQNGLVSVTNGVALTIDSSHNVSIDPGGAIGIPNGGPGSTGILINGGNTANLTVRGAISVTDGVDQYKDEDGDGDLDGPWATGTDRYGIRVAGAGVLTGDIRLETDSSLLVKGNDSYGVSIETGLVGRLAMTGGVLIAGDNVIAVRTLATIDGSVYVGGTVTANGLNATAVSIGGDLNGRLSIQGDITSSGYRYTTRPGDEFIAGLDPDDLLQGGSAVIISANVANGVVFDTPHVGTDDNNHDEDDDGIVDLQEGSAVVRAFGAAPAVVVGSQTQTVTLGVGTATADAYGFINRGTISGQGVYDGVSSTGVQFGVAGGQGVIVDGGVRNEGTITALSYEADATAVRFANGSTTPTFITSGAITAAAATEQTSQVTTLQIDAGASLPSFVNSGLFLASAGGGTANVTAIRDDSGTLTSILNQGSLQATLSSNEAGDPITGRTIAIDARANTAGLSLVQEGVVGTPSATDPDTDGDGVPDSKEPILVGDILLGSGGDTVDIRNGLVNSNIDFGTGADRLTISGGAVVRGAITNGDGQLDIAITDGVLEATQSSATNASSLTVGQDGALIFGIDAAAGAGTGFNVSGAANFADGAAIGVKFTSLLDTPQRFTLVQAGSLAFGQIDRARIEENSSYMFVMDVNADVASGQVYVDARRRSADEIGMIASESAAYDSVYDALRRDEELRNVYLNQAARAGFIDLYEQMLPDHSGGPLLSLASGVDAVTRALTGRNAAAAPGETSAWLQEINFYADKDKTDTYGFRSEGFGVAGGVEHGTDNGALGVSVAFTSSDLHDPEAEAGEVLSASLLELGLYWRAQGQYWTTWARAAAGYASFESTRTLVGGGLYRTNESSWNGYTLAAAGGLSYERNYGRFTLRPEIYAEYFSLSEDGHAESGGGDGFDLAIDARDSHMFSAVAAMNISMAMGQDSWLRPELRLGWRQNISVDPGRTIARFVSGGPDFVLDPANIEGGGPIVGFRVNVGNELGMLSVTADAEFLENYVRYMLMLRASFRF